MKVHWSSGCGDPAGWVIGRQGVNAPCAGVEVKLLPAGVCQWQRVVMSKSTPQGFLFAMRFSLLAFTN